MIPGSARRIPHYISARSPSGLQRLMFANNLKDGVEHQYFDIGMHQNRWYAWFYKEVKTSEPELITRSKAVKQGRVDSSIDSQKALNDTQQSGE